MNELLQKFKSLDTKWKLAIGFVAFIVIAEAAKLVF